MRQEQASWGRVAGGLRNPCARLGEAGGGCLGAIFSPRNLTGPLGCCCGGGRCGAVSLHTLHDAPHTLHTLSSADKKCTHSAPEKFSPHTFQLWPMHPRNASQYNEQTQLPEGFCIKQMHSAYYRSKGECS